jgi:hypothetical protein
MRTLTVAVTAAILAAVLIFSRAVEPPSRAAAKDVDGKQPRWFKVVFGLDGQDAVWDGKVRVNGGELLDIDPWSFEARDQVDADDSSWTIRTATIAGRRATYAEPSRGVLLHVAAGDGTHVVISSEQGNFDFDPSAIVAGRPAEFLEGRASVEVLGTESLVADTSTDDDFTAIAVKSNGDRFVMWQAYDELSKRDELLIRNVDEPGSDTQRVFDATEFSSPHLFVVKQADGSETLRAVFCSPGKHANWDVYSAIRTGQGWRPERLSSTDGSDIFLAASQADDGSIWIAWQTFRSGKGEIVARRLHNGKWSDELDVTSKSLGDRWEPAIAAVDHTTAWVGHDSYYHGNYDVYVQRVIQLKDSAGVEKAIAVATSPDFEAHCSLLADGRNKCWVAYDAGGPGWGKDHRSGQTMGQGEYAEPLHASRRIELRVIADGKVMQPVEPLPQVRPPDRIHLIERKPDAKPSRFYEYPQLTRDADGRMWLFFRMCRQGYCAHPPMGIDWRVCATTSTEDGWLEPIELPRSQGRQNQRVAFAPGVDAPLELAWSDGNRFASVNRKFSVHHGRLPPVSGTAEVELTAVELDEPGEAEREPRVLLKMEKGGELYHVFFGDLHRHTNISRCMPTIDGSLDDAHRYAINAVEYDFLAVTDHTRDVDPFSWWRTQKANDWFNIPGRYVPIHAYERSNRTDGGGHRNVFFLKRGAAINPSDHWADGVGRTKPDTNPDTTLYPWMKERGETLTAAHTPEWSKASGKGTWTYNDPQVEPVAEIFQGFRRSYERPGPSVAEQASLWHALKKGYRLGFIASSDHMSTHMSFACVWAKEKTRESIFEALKARRTYAATDRIGLAYYIGDALMGEETQLRPGEDAKLDIKVRGTAEVKEIQVVRSGTVILTAPKPGVPGERDVNLQFTDANTPDGSSYYYVRVVQENEAIAWGSPIWVKR